MADGIQEMADQAGIKVLVNRVSSFFQVHFGIDRIKNKRDSLKADKAAANLFHLGLRANGVMASYHPLFLSAAHTDAHVDRVLAAANLVFSEMSKSD
jgi:glutamate-1-semialdehyde aminotransferase